VEDFRWLSFVFALGRFFMVMMVVMVLVGGDAFGHITSTRLANRFKHH
jgi:hypothetical protein